MHYLSRVQQGELTMMLGVMSRRRCHHRLASAEAALFLLSRARSNFANMNVHNFLRAADFEFVGYLDVRTRVRQSARKEKKAIIGEGV